MSEVKFYRLDKGVEYNDSPLRIPAGTIVVTAFAHAEAMNALQARLAQCEQDKNVAIVERDCVYGERAKIEEELKVRTESYEGAKKVILGLEAERDAALERGRTGRGK